MLKFVVKADGRKENFDREKLMSTALRSGASEKAAKNIVNLIEVSFPTVASTRDVYKLMLNELEKISEKHSSLFGLRESIAELDSISFEIYASKILEANGYTCELNKIVQGRNIEHQIDVITVDSLGHSYYIECKRHVNPHRFSGLELPLEVQARLEDLREGFIDGKNPYNFSSVWIFTNTKFSEHAKTYARKKGILMTGWSTEERSLQELIEKHKVYPITILKIDSNSKSKLLRNRIITLQDVLSNKSKVDSNILQKSREILGI